MTDLTVLDDPTALARHREPMHARWTPSTGKVLSLDGMWDFHYAARPAAAPQGFESPAFDLAGWSVLPVPANWELHGHGEALYQNIRYPFPANPPLAPDENPTGSYRRWFDLPTDFAGQRVYLELGSADSACHVWVNGVEVGYNTDSKLPASFEVTRHLHPGRNLVAVRVYRWPSSAYLEKQDYWHVSGLQRSVRLIAKPAAHLRDWCVSTTALAADGSATVCARPRPPRPTAWCIGQSAPRGASASACVTMPVRWWPRPPHPWRRRRRCTGSGTVACTRRR
jgi:beta-galactosidase